MSMGSSAVCLAFSRQQQLSQWRYSSFLCAQISSRPARPNSAFLPPGLVLPLALHVQEGWMRELRGHKGWSKCLELGKELASVLRG